MLAVVALGMSFGTNDLTQACAVLSMFPGAAFMCTQADDFWRPFRKSQYIFVHFFYHLKHKNLPWLSMKTLPALSLIGDNLNLYPIRVIIILSSLRYIYFATGHP